MEQLHCLKKTKCLTLKFLDNLHFLLVICIKLIASSEKGEKIKGLDSCYLTWLAITMGSRSQRTSFKSGDHLAVKIPVTITSSGQRRVYRP